MKKEELKTLIDLSEDIHALDSKGWSLLHYAVYFKDMTSFKKLLARGADINLLSLRDCSVLHVASCAGHFDLVDHVIKAGANMTAQDNYGETPLHKACLKKPSSMSAIKKG